jgi:hypothetical protein
VEDPREAPLGQALRQIGHRSAGLDLQAGVFLSGTHPAGGDLSFHNQDKELTMADTDQSQGRNDNDAIPESEAQARAGKTGKVAGEHKSFGKDGAIPGPDDFKGPAGDPAEGKR